MQWFRILLEVIAHELVKLFDRQDTVLSDPTPELDTIGDVDVDDVLNRYGGLLD